MDRFLSNTINKLDKKGRVSIPAPFRPVLAGEQKLYARLGIDRPVVEVGGEAFFKVAEDRLAQMDPFSEEYETFSTYIHGDTFQLSMDGEGRVVLPESILWQCGISHEVSFVGRGHFFEIWEPAEFEAYRKTARARVASVRRSLASNPKQGGKNTTPSGTSNSNLTGSGATHNKEQGS